MFCSDFPFALFLSRQAVKKQMRDEREGGRGGGVGGQRERERGRKRDVGECRETESLMGLIFWMGELEYILLYRCIFFPPGNSESIKHLVLGS